MTEGELPKMKRIGRPWQMLSIPLQRWQELQGKQRHTMNPGMTNPLISMLYPTTIITVKEVLLTGTGAPLKITMSAVGTTAKTIHPGRIATKNQCVTTVWVPITFTKCLQYQKDKDRYKYTTQQVKQSFRDKLKHEAKKNSISINEAYFENEEDDNPGNYSEEQAEKLCKLLDT